MKLPNGITGFYNSEADKPPQVDEKQFKQLCFDSACRNSGKVIDFNASQYPANFYNAQVEIFDKRFNILLNEYYPYLAFASVVEFGNISFIDIPVLFEPFSPFYQVLGTAELNVPIRQILREKDKNALNSSELKQLAYWKPETAGQVIFNYWD
jgi:hypothetical protein